MTCFHLWKNRPYCHTCMDLKFQYFEILFCGTYKFFNKIVTEVLKPLRRNYDNSCTKFQSYEEFIKYDLKAALLCIDAINLLEMWFLNIANNKHCIRTRITTLIHSFYYQYGNKTSLIIHSYTSLC